MKTTMFTAAKNNVRLSKIVIVQISRLLTAPWVRIIIPLIRQKVNCFDSILFILKGGFSSEQKDNT